MSFWTLFGPHCWDDPPVAFIADDSVKPVRSVAKMSVVLLQPRIFINSALVLKVYTTVARRDHNSIFFKLNWFTVKLNRETFAVCNTNNNFEYNRRKNYNRKKKIYSRRTDLELTPVPEKCQSYSRVEVDAREKNRNWYKYSCWHASKKNNVIIVDYLPRSWDNTQKKMSLITA